MNMLNGAVRLLLDQVFYRQQVLLCVSRKTESKQFDTAVEMLFLESQTPTKMD